jgi:hypothetical protein
MSRPPLLSPFWLTRISAICSGSIAVSNSILQLVSPGGSVPSLAHAAFAGQGRSHPTPVCQLLLPAESVAPRRVKRIADTFGTSSSGHNALRAMLCLQPVCDKCSLFATDASSIGRYSPISFGIS